MPKVLSKAHEKGSREKDEIPKLLLIEDLATGQKTDERIYEIPGLQNTSNTIKTTFVVKKTPF